MSECDWPHKSSREYPTQWIMPSEKRGNIPPKKRRKHHTTTTTSHHQHKHHRQQLSEKQAEAKSLSIEEQLRIQRQKQREQTASSSSSLTPTASATTTTNSTRSSDSKEEVNQNAAILTVKGFLYDEKTQRYFKASDRKKALHMAPGGLPAAFDKKISVVRRPQVSQSSVISALRRRQLSGIARGVDFTGVLARSVRLECRDTFPDTLIGIDYHPLFGKLLVTPACLLRIRSHSSSDVMRLFTTSHWLIISARWAPDCSSPLVGAALRDPQRGVYRVVVMSGTSDAYHELSSTTLLDLSEEEGVIQVQWIRSGLHISLVVCCENVVYKVDWPSGRVSRMCTVISPAMSFVGLSSPDVGCDQTAGGVIGLRNGSILLIDPRTPNSRCSKSKKRTPSDAHVTVGRMKHCVDHMYALRGGLTLLAQDVVGNVSLFDLRRSTDPAMHVVRKNRAASTYLIKGSSFWVSCDEKMIMVSGVIDEPDVLYHNRAIDIWCLTDPERRHHQVPIPRPSVIPSLYERGSNPCLNQSFSNTLLFAPNCGGDNLWGTYNCNEYHANEGQASDQGIGCELPSSCNTIGTFVASVSRNCNNSTEPESILFDVKIGK